MKSLDAEKKSSAKVDSIASAQDAKPVVTNDNNGFFIANEKIDFSNVKAICCLRKQLRDYATVK